MAKPTWTRTNSPTAASGIHDKQTSRVMPPNFTFPKVMPLSSRTAMISPGMPRHMSAPILPSLPSVGCDGGLPQRDAAVVGRNSAMEEDLEAVGFEQTVGD